MSKTQTIDDKFDDVIERLNQLASDAEAETWDVTDVGESGGSTVQAINRLEKCLDEMKTAYVELVKHTSSYMSNRKASITQVDADGAAKVSK